MTATRGGPAAGRRPYQRGMVVRRGRQHRADAGARTAQQQAHALLPEEVHLKRGAMVAGKVLPAGIGAIVGAVGNRMMGKRIVENARAAFGAAPARWTTTLRVLPAVGDNTGN